MNMLSFNSLVCWQITLTLLHVSWIGLVIGLIAALANAVLRNSTANRSYWLNFASLLLFAASLPITFAIVRGVTVEVPAALIVAETPVAELVSLIPPSIDAHAFSTPPTDVADFAPPSPQLLPSDAEISAAVPTPTLLQSSPSAWERVTSIGHAAAPFVAILYAIGVALMFVKLAYGVRVSRKLRSTSQPVSDATILARLAEQAKKLSLRITPIVAYGEHTAVPIVVGLLRPMILIPAAMVNGLTIEQLESVLTHELAHLRRCDHLMIVVQRVLEAILFFHPVTWYLSHRLHDDRETSCDDLVLSIGGDRLQYAQSLLRVAELRLAVQPQHIALAADGQRPSKLRQRIARLLGDSESDSVRMGSIWPAATVLLFLLGAIASLSSSIRPAIANVQEDVELDYEAVLKLAGKAYENPAPITTAHVRFRIAELSHGLQKEMTSEKCRQLLSESGVTLQPDKLKDLLGSLIRDPNQLDAKPWTNVDLYQGEPGIRTTTSTSTNGPDYWIGGQWSYRWDSAKSQASLLRREDDRFHNDERLDEFLRNRRMTFANLKFQKPISIRKDGEKILLQFDRNSALEQETTLDAVSGRIHSVANSSHGVVIQERLQLGWRAFNDDIWLPTIIAELRYRRGDLDHCRFIVIEDASFNQPLPDDVFRFGVPAGSVISDKRVGLNQTYTLSSDVADVTSDEQLAAAKAPLSDASDEIQNPQSDANKLSLARKKNSVLRTPDKLPTDVAQDADGDVLPVGVVQRFGSTRFRTDATAWQTVRFSENGEWVWCKGNRLSVIHRETGHVVKQNDLGLAEISVSAVAMSPEANRVVLAGVTGSVNEHVSHIVLLNSNTADPIAKFNWKSGSTIPSAIAISRDGKKVLSINYRDVRLWDLETGEQLKQHNSGTPLKDAAFSPDGTKIVLVGDDGALTDGSLFWDLSSDTEPKRLQTQIVRQLSTSFSPDGRYFATSAIFEKDGVRLWDGKTGTLIRQFKANGTTAHADGGFCFSPDNTTLIVPGIDSNVIELWDVESGKLERSIQMPGPRSVTITSDGKWLAVGDSQRLCVIDLQSAINAVEPIEGHLRSVAAVRFLGRDKVLTVDQANLLCVWDMATGKYLTGQEMTGLVYDGAVAVSADKAILAINPVGKQMHVLEAATGKTRFALPGHGDYGSARALSFSPDGKSILSFGDNSKLCTWDSATGVEQSSFALEIPGYTYPTPRPWDHLSSAIFSHDGKSLYVNFGTTLFQFDTTDGHLVGKAETPNLHVMAVSPNGQWIATFEYSNGTGEEQRQIDTMRLRDTKTLEVVFEIPHIEGLAATCQFSADSQLIAWSRSGSNVSSLVEIVDLDTKKLVAQIPQRSPAAALQFSADSEIIVTGNRDSTATVWKIDAFPVGRSVSQ